MPAKGVTVLGRSEMRKILSLGWPVVVGQVGLMLMGVVDTLMVGRFGGEALAGVGLGHTWSFAVLGVGVGAALGMDPALTQAWGARDATGFGRAMAHGAVLMGLLCPVLVCGHAPAGMVLGWLGQPEEVLPLAQSYSVVVGASVPAMLGWGLLRQALQAQERMWPATVLVLVGNVLNVVVNGVLLFGWGTGVPFGPEGSAWATLLIRWGLFVGLAVVARGEIRVLGSHLSGVRVRGLWNLSAVAIPIAIQTSLELWSFTLATFVVGWFGPVAVAAHGVTLNLAALSFMIPLGLGGAAATRVGNLVGAGLDWRPAAFTALAMGGGVMLVGASVFAGAPQWLARLYVPGDPEVVALASRLLPIAAAFGVFDGLQVVAFGILRGLGDVRLPALANVVAFYVVGLPTGAWLAFKQGWGPQGVWIGTAIGLGLVSLLLVARIVWRASR